MGGAPGTAYDCAFWTAVFALYDAVWPDMSGRLAEAEALGAPWAPTTHPFAWFEGGRALAHVGVLLHPVRLSGRDRVVAGVHAVCAHPDARGRGLVRACMDRAMAWIDSHADLAKLGTHHAGLYERWGFEPVPTHVFRSAGSGGGGPARLLRPTRVPADRALLRAALASRVVVSDVFSTRDDGWLVIIDLALYRGLDTWAWHLPDLDAVLFARHEGGDLVIHDLAAPLLPSVERLLGSVALPFDSVCWRFPPDRFDPAAVAVRRDVGSELFLVRGAWPSVGPVGFSELWEH